MDPSGAVAEMPKQPKRGRGRPPASEPMKSLVSLKGTPSFEEWLDGLVKTTRFGTRALLLKNALQDMAEKYEYKKPMPER
jgi:hypothetical protein